MAIHIFCPVCKKSYGLESKDCSKCGTPFGKNKKYRVCVSDKGKRITKVVENLTLAREWETAKKTDLLRGDLDINHKVNPTLTLNELWIRYLSWAKENKKSWRDDKWYFSKHLEPRFGNKRLDAISPMDIERMKKELREGGEGVRGRHKPYAPATIKHQIAILRRLFNLARKWNLYEGKSPVESVEMPKLNNQLTEYLKEDELARLHQTLDNWPCKESVAIIRFALYTGFRRGEIFKLTWDDVDFTLGLCRLRDPKGGKTKIFPISHAALDVLRSLDRTCPYIFPGQGAKKRTNFRGPWYKIRKASGLPDNFRFHGLRHHFASALVSNGVDLAVVQELLTHKDPKTTQRYAHLAPGALKEAALKSGNLLRPEARPDLCLEKKS
jgi:integrase